MQIFEGHFPRWLIFLIDILICAVALFLAYLLRFNFALPAHEIPTLPMVFSVILIIRALSFFIAKTYSGIIRYTGTKDAQRIFIVVSLGSAIFCVGNLVFQFFHPDQIYFIPFSIVIIEYMASTFILISSRVCVKVLYFELKNPNREKKSIIIYGAGESGLIAKRTLDRDVGTKYKVIGIIDDDPRKTGKKLEGVTIYSFTDLPELLSKNAVAHLIISIQQLSNERKKAIIEYCLANNTKVLNVPPAKKWINGELSFKQIKKIKIEELLERDPIYLDVKLIQGQIKNNVILVTGAAGSIGSELVNQISKYNPSKIILLDQAESGLYDLEMSIYETYGKELFEIVIGDIRNIERMENLFRTFRPSLVYHAAAYKHVPMMENNPSEAILTNVHGTKIIADLSVKYGVREFVMVSTDKAVNPTNIMGASKRIAEIYIQSLNKNTGTKFITTRFGNVLGSSGSVIPRFQKQIDSGGPITITHPEITRFFMTIPEACQLVLEAGAMGKGGEIFLFDMGDSVKILDLAKKMIKLSGLTLGKDIQIIYSGLRPGEKLFEELLNNKEKTIPTHHSQILIAKVPDEDYETVNFKIQHLISLFPSQDNVSIVSQMKKLVPEYISNNSIYEMLDREPVTAGNS